MSDNFIPVSEFEHPNVFPYDITFFLKDGTLKGPLTVGDKYTKFLLDNVLAVKVEVQHLGQRLLGRFFRENDSLPYGQAEGARKFAEWLADNNLFAEEPKDTSWLDSEIDRIGKSFNVPNSYRKDIRNWFENPEHYPEVPFNIGNVILTVKPVGHSGRVVCLPTGHTLAYSYARALYRILCGSDPYDYHVNPHRIRVREHLGGRTWSDVRTRKWKMSNGFLEIGCQRVPARAIEELAKREGWGGKIVSKYL